MRVTDSNQVTFRCTTAGTALGYPQPSDANRGDGFDVRGSRNITVLPSVQAINNGGDGLEITGPSRRVRSLGASLFDHAGLGIDLGVDGANGNDTNDTDVGPNGLVNTPQVLAAGAAASPTRQRVYVRVNHATSVRKFRVDVYLNAWCDPVAGEAMRWIGAGVYDTTSRLVRVDLAFPVPHTLLTATVTTAAGTSELSDCLHRNAVGDTEIDTTTAVGPITTIDPTGNNPADGTSDDDAIDDGITGDGNDDNGPDDGGNGQGDNDNGGSGTGGNDNPTGPNDLVPVADGYIVTGPAGEITVDPSGLLDGAGGNAPVQAVREPGGDIPAAAWQLSRTGRITLDATNLQPGLYHGLYSVTDRDGDRSAPGTILFIVTGPDGWIPEHIDDPPPPTPAPAPDSYTVAPGTTPTFTGTRAVLANDFAGNAATLTATLVDRGGLGNRLTLTAAGALTLNATGLAEGSYTARYRLNADGASAGTTTITIVVDNGNQCPTARDDDYTVKTGDVLNVAGPNGAFNNDTDPEGDTITVRLVGQFNQSDIGFNTNTGAVYLDATGDAPGNTRGFSYIAKDPSGESCGQVRVTINIKANEPPTATLDYFEVYPGQNLNWPGSRSAQQRLRH